MDKSLDEIIQSNRNEHQIWISDTNPFRSSRDFPMIERKIADWIFDFLNDFDSDSFNWRTNAIVRIYYLPCTSSEPCWIEYLSDVEKKRKRINEEHTIVAVRLRCFEYLRRSFYAWFALINSFFLFFSSLNIV